MWVRTQIEGSRIRVLERGITVQVWGVGFQYSFERGLTSMEPISLTYSEGISAWGRVQRSRFGVAAALQKRAAVLRRARIQGP